MLVMVAMYAATAHGHGMHLDRTAAAVNRAFTLFGVRGHVVATEEGIVIPAEDVARVGSSVAYVEGGNRAPFVRTLLQRGRGADVTLRGDEGMLLVKALEEIARTRDRRAAIDRGRLPGVLSGSEVSYIARKYPHRFGR